MKSNFIFRIYYPLCLRIEKFRAVRIYHEGVKLADKMYKEIGAPRVYLFFDSKHLVWSPMTYTDNKKLKPSLRRLLIMGKIKGRNIPADVEQMKAYSFYYTASKWGAKSVNDIPHLRAQKLQKWISYYLTSLSVPMQKCRQYQNQLKTKSL